MGTAGRGCSYPRPWGRHGPWPWYRRAVQFIRRLFRPAAWLALVAMLARRHASALRALHARFQEKLAASEPKPEEKPAVTPTPAEQPAE